MFIDHILPVLVAALLWMLPPGSEGPAADPAHLPDLDASQALMMLDFLEAVSRGEDTGELVDSLLSLEGTELILGQMNLMRLASKAQYRALLLALVEGVEPALQPVDSSSGSLRGVRGLMRDVWPTLNWGVANTDLLRERVARVGVMDLMEEARTLAGRFLPGPLQVSPRVFLVMGGRAGAAALDGDRIYLDPLRLSYLGRRQGSFPDDEDLLRTVAHEIHHIGYADAMEVRRREMAPSRPAGLLFRFLTSLIAEGSATYLISEDRDLAGMRDKRLYASWLEDEAGLVDRVEAVAEDILAERIITEADYLEMEAELAGSWFHSAGAVFLGRIDGRGGLTRVMAVLANPNRLFTEFNAAAGGGAAGPRGGLVDPDLAEQVLRLGGTTPPQYPSTP